MFSSFVTYSRRFAAVVCFVVMLGLSVSAMPSLFEEWTERVEGSPFQVFSILSESLREGVSAVEADWVSWRNDQERLALRFYSNMYDHDYALSFEIVDCWEAIDFNLFLNRERVAFSSSYFGDSAFGLQFATLDEDLHAFFEWLQEHDIITDAPTLLEEILEYVDVIQEFLASDITTQVDPLEFLDMLLPLILQAEQSMEQVIVDAGGTSVNADRITLTFDMAVLLDAVFEMLYTASGDTMFNELRYDIQQDMENVQATITVAAYMTDTGRLVQIGTEFSTVETRINWWSGEEETGNSTLSIIANFGAHATDTWLFTIDVENIWRSHTITVAWEISEPDSDSIEHKLVVSMSDDDNLAWELLDQFEDMLYETGLFYDFWYADYDEDFAFDFWYGLWNEFLKNRPAPQLQHIATIGMLWNRTSGELVFFYEDEDGREDTRGIVTSILTMDASSFNLHISDSDFNFEASATVGAPVPSVDFINLDRWAEIEFMQALVEDITRSRAISAAAFDDQWDDFDFSWILDDFDFDWDDFDFNWPDDLECLCDPLPFSIPIPPMPVTDLVTWPASHVVQVGDSMTRIAVLFYGEGTAEENLMRAELIAEYNNLLNWEAIQVGQTLLIPALATQVVQDTSDITIEGPVPAQNTALVIRDLNLRRGPGVSYEAFNHVLAGDTVVVLETRGTWVKVETDKGTGWVFGRYLGMQ